MTTELLKC